MIAILISFFILSITIFGIKALKIENNNIVGTNIVFALDVSKSMNALDFNNGNDTYSRLTASKKFIGDFIEKNPGNKYALVVFAGDAIRVLPFTNDADLFMTILLGVNENNISKQGTNLKDAITEGFKNFTEEDDYGVLVLISDGGDETDLNISDFKNSKNPKDVKLFVMGVGGTKGAYIPIGQDPFGKMIYKTYNSQTVVTKLNEQSLKKLASFFDGDYFSLTQFSSLDNKAGLLKNVTTKTFFSKSENIVDLTRIITFVSFVFFLVYLIFLLWVGKK
ncbi:MAG: VWA domain-containing protein [Candidatus Gracilibacteria bacterium]